MKKTAWTIILFVVCVTTAYILINYYSYIFARNVVGVVVSVEKPVVPTALVGVGTGSQATSANATTLFSYAVAIREESGEIVTASTEDRQWAVAQVGKCAKAKYYPYAPWNFDKSGTYHNARLLELRDCPPELKPTAEAVQEIQQESLPSQVLPQKLPPDSAPADAAIQVE